MTASAASAGACARGRTHAGVVRPRWRVGRAPWNGRRRVATRDVGGGPCQARRHVRSGMPRRAIWPSQRSGLRSRSMGRPLRVQPVGGVVHVSTRGVRRQPIFVDDLDRRMFIAFLAQSVHRCRWTCLAYCLMANHFHLVFGSRAEPLDRNAPPQRASTHAASTNATGTPGICSRRASRRRVIESDAHLLEAIRYVVLNPVRAENLQRPGRLAVEQFPRYSWARAVSALPRRRARPTPLRRAGPPARSSTRPSFASGPSRSSARRPDRFGPVAVRTWLRAWHARARRSAAHRGALSRRARRRGARGRRRSSTSRRRPARARARGSPGRAPPPRAAARRPSRAPPPPAGRRRAWSGPEA